MSSILKPVLGSQLNFGHLLARGLVGCYLMNRGPGNDEVSDLSGNGGTGIITGMTWQAGPSGHVLRAVNATDVITLPASYKPLGGVSQFSIVASVLVNTIVSDGGIFYTDEHTGSDAILLWLDNAATDYFACILNGSGGGAGPLYGSTAISTGEWHQVILTYNAADKIRLYVDGVEEGGGFPANPIGTIDVIDGPEKYKIANDRGENKDLDGDIEYLYLYNRDLSASESALIYREPFCMFERDPIELWSAATIGAPSVGMAGAMTTNPGVWGW